MKNKEHLFRFNSEVAETPFVCDAADAWPKVEQRLTDQLAPVSNPVLRPISWAAAAAVVIALGWFTLIRPSSELAFNSLRTGLHEVQELLLPDQSKVSLGALTELSYPSTWNERVVSLAGQAFFEVTRGKTFLVNTPSGTIEVLGTSFSVVARPERFEVTCFTGRVKVQADGDELEIGAGETARKSDSGLVKVAAQGSSWNAGEFNFEQERLDVVLHEVARQFNVKLEWNDLGERFYTGSFTNDDLSEALENICLPMNLIWTQANETITIVPGKQDGPGS